MKYKDVIKQCVLKVVGEVDGQPAPIVIDRVGMVFDKTEVRRTLQLMFDKGEIETDSKLRLVVPKGN